MSHAVTEEWRRVAGTAYEVSDQGQVRSLKHIAPRLMTPFLKRGYLYVSLTVGGRTRSHRVHGLVLEAFVGPCPDGHECRHFPDRTKTNNRLCNLSWGTRLQNMADQYVHGTRAAGDRHGSRTMPESRARGSRNGAIRHPERLARGAQNGAYTKPHRVPRGERHWSVTKPERLQRGSARWNAALTEDVALQIKTHRGWLSTRHLASVFGVSQTAVRYAQTKGWKHVETTREDP